MRPALSLFATLVVVIGVACTGTSPEQDGQVTLLSPTTSPARANGRAGSIVIEPPAELRAGVPAVFTVKISAALVRLTIEWGDMTTTDADVSVTEATVTHVYDAPGTYFLTIRATDPNGATMSATSSVEVK